MTTDDHNLWKRVAETLSNPFKRTAGIRPLVPSTVLDLHGYTINEAHKASLAFVKFAYANKLKSITIITGRSGQIKQEFVYWFENNALVREINSMNGGGAFKIHIRKSK